jgi:hypothetical protein
MRARTYAYWTCIAVALVIVAAFLPRPALAAECAASLDEVVTAVEAKGGTLLDLIDMPGDGFDQLVFFDSQGTIIMGLAFRGCIVSPPVGVGKMREVTPA